MKKILPSEKLEQVFMGIDMFKRHPKETYEIFIDKVINVFLY